MTTTQRTETIRGAVLATGAVALGATLGCALPLAALAAVAAKSLSARFAFATVAVACFADQLAGFTIRHYPREPSVFAWGVVLAVAALGATAAARRMPALALALPLAFAVDQIVVAAYGAVVHDLSGQTWSALGSIALANAAGFALLAPLSYLVTLAARRSQRAPG